jgi:hypothetical protein
MGKFLQKESPPWLRRGWGWFVPIEHLIDLFHNQKAYIDCFLHAVEGLFTPPFQTTPTPSSSEEGNKPFLPI